MASITISYPRSRLSIVIFHAYTCSPLEFRDLAEELSERFEANVFVPALPGHMTKREDLLAVSYADYRKFAVEFVREHVPSDHRLVLMGHCFGGYLAAEAAMRTNPVCTILLMVPFHLRWYLRLPFLSSLMRLKAWWKKPIPPSDNARRSAMRFYDAVPGTALKLMEDAAKDFRAVVAEIPSPILSINISGDRLEDRRSPELLGSFVMKKSEYETHSLRGEHHELLLGENAPKVRRILIGYIAKQLEHLEELRKKEAPVGDERFE